MAQACVLQALEIYPDPALQATALKIYQKIVKYTALREQGNNWPRPSGYCTQDLPEDSQIHCPAGTREQLTPPALQATALKIYQKIV